ncbi:hypothetical protein Jab_2c06400 [Janthinobacterium sp. HH01]|uniref:DUF4936 family protein n=1 Tax=Janthinobacterium sp. HH01 TaxID=1198452 RepID=UPI0002AEA579|nr:DUF4936 family protein [Janthinobacterium sp. HH01]ELX08585.1 hypothetical protein Jab_2c06400 [Janthinobacterium sp. HH01]
MDLYIYYQVKDGDASSLLAAVVAMQAALGAQHGVFCQLKRRPQATDGKQTWMEVYAATPEAFAAALERAVEQAGLSAWIAGPRHTEVFTDLVTCA